MTFKETMETFSFRTWKLIQAYICGLLWDATTVQPGPKKNPSSRTIPLNVTAEIAGRRRWSSKLPTLVFKTVRLRSKSSECVFEDDRRQHSALCSPVPLSGSKEEEGVGGRSWFNGVHLFFAVAQSVKTSGREGKRQYTPGQLSDTGIHLLAARTRKCSANVTRRKCFLHSRS